jgi:Protein of unknown function (DUF2752)
MTARPATHPARRRPGGRPVLVAVGLVAAAVADRIADPVHHDLPLCPFRLLTGLSCPLCGGLRSAYALTRFDLAAAVRDNVLLVAALPLLLAYWLDWVRRDRRRLPGRRLPRAAVVALWTVAAAFTIVRNLPVLAPWLAPPPS